MWIIEVFGMILKINWTSLFIGVLIGLIVGGGIAAFIFYRIGYNKMWDKAHEHARMHMLSWHL